MNIIKCLFCGTVRNINKFYLNFDERDKSEKNIILCCEKCRNLFYEKVMFNAVKVCKDLGLMVDKEGHWIYNNDTVRKELESVRSLKDEITRLREDTSVLQDKLRQLVNKGYDREIQLKEDELILDFDFHHHLYCKHCGKKIELFKRDGKYLGSCCNHVYMTRIDRLIVTIV